MGKCGGRILEAKESYLLLKHRLELRFHLHMGTPGQLNTSPKGVPRDAAASTEFLAKITLGRVEKVRMTGNIQESSKPKTDRCLRYGFSR